MIIRDFAKEDLDDVIECVRESFVEEFEAEGLEPQNLNGYSLFNVF